MIGTRVPCARSDWQTSKPLMPGSMTSSSSSENALVRERVQAFLARRDRGDLIALELEVVGEHRSHLRLVLDHQHVAGVVGSGGQRGS